jgi:hypothetical protein
MFSPFTINLCTTIIISILIISILHYLWEYIKDTYSTKKVKDLVNTQIEKYKVIASTTILDSGSPKEDGFTEFEKESMQEDLQNFISSLN